MKNEAKSSLRWLGITRYQVKYLVQGRERQSPWFSCRQRAHDVRAMLMAKHGENAVVYVD
jgi:hypothetical protein